METLKRMHSVPQEGQISRRVNLAQVLAPTTSTTECKSLIATQSEQACDSLAKMLATLVQASITSHIMSLKCHVTRCLINLTNGDSFELDESG